MSQVSLGRTSARFLLAVSSRAVSSSRRLTWASSMLAYGAGSAPPCQTLVAFESESRGKTTKTQRARAS
jgi:hypothetical protein